jgi:hypothetical protein
MATAPTPIWHHHHHSPRRVSHLRRVAVLRFAIGVLLALAILLLLDGDAAGSGVVAAVAAVSITGGWARTRRRKMIAGTRQRKRW